MIEGAYLIALAGIVHVFFSHLAVGGGILIAVTEQLAYNASYLEINYQGSEKESSRWYAFIKEFSKPFVFLTTVIGVVSGLAMWWTIALYSPNATAVLLHVFAPLWSVESWIFLVEILTILVYYIYYDRLENNLGLFWRDFMHSFLFLLCF